MTIVKLRRILKSQRKNVLSILKEGNKTKDISGVKYCAGYLKALNFVLKQIPERKRK